MPVPLRDEFLRLLREDEEFRYAVLGLLGISDLRGAVGELVNAVKALTDEVRKLREDVNKLWEAIKTLQEGQNRLWEENNRIWEAIKALQEGQNRLWEVIRALQEQVKALQEGQNKLWEEVKALREDVNKLWQENNKIWQEIKALREGQEKLWIENDKLWEAVKALQEQVKALVEGQSRLAEKIDNLNRKIDALGARWGLLAENAFREGMRGIVERILGVASVGRWTYNDDRGVVYGHPAVIDVDLVIKDGVHILVEVKASASRGDVAEFWRIGRLYEEVNGVKPRLIIITPYIDEKAKELAKELGIEVYTP